MIQSDILKEKDRVQTELSKEHESIHEYLKNSHAAAEEIARTYGFQLQYAEMPDKTPLRPRANQAAEL